MNESICSYDVSESFIKSPEVDPSSVRIWFVVEKHFFGELIGCLKNAVAVIYRKVLFMLYLLLINRT